MLYHIMLRYVMLCYVMLRYVMLCYVMLCCIMLCYVMSCYVQLCYDMLCYVMPYYVMLSYIKVYYQNFQIFIFIFVVFLLSTSASHPLHYQFFRNSYLGNSCLYFLIYMIYLIKRYHVNSNLLFYLYRRAG